MKKLKRKNLLVIAFLIVLLIFTATIILKVILLNQAEEQLAVLEKKEKIANTTKTYYKNRNIDVNASFEELCFVMGTKVITPNGFVNIEDLKVGDSVYSRNEKTDEIEIKKVLQTFESDYEFDTLRIFTKDSSVEATLNHKFYEKNKEWIEAKELKVGDILVNNSNEELEIIKIENIKSEGVQKVYNLEVEDNHNYFVGFDCVLVHNCCVDPFSEVLVSLSGETRAIQFIKSGDKVVTFNFKTGKNELKTVTKTTIKNDVTDIVTITFADGTQIIQNMYHEMYTKEGWKSLTNLNGNETLEVGDIVKTENGWKEIKTIDIELRHEETKLYTIDTEDNNNFYANGTLMKGY